MTALYETGIFLAIMAVLGAATWCFFRLLDLVVRVLEAFDEKEEG